MISLVDAQKIILETAAPLAAETVGLEGAAGRILAEDVLATSDLPPFDRAMMDGYALRSADVTEAPATLTIKGEVRAGTTPRMTVKAGEAVYITTGSPIPKGADAVQMVEKAQVEEGGGQVRVLEPVPRGANCSPLGEILRQGTVALEAGTLLGALELAVLASQGITGVPVVRQPRVAIMTTGDEVVDAHRKPNRSQIRDSNSHTLAALVQQFGGAGSRLGIAPDEPEGLKTLVRQGLEADLLLTTGGVSMGRHDLVPQVLDDLAVETLFHKVAIKPGKPVAFGRRDGCLLFNLPGNPLASVIGFYLLVLPALTKMQGRPLHLPRHLSATLHRPITRRPDRREYLPATLEMDGGTLITDPIKQKGSADIVSWLGATALIVAPRGVDKFGEGQTVEILLLKDFSFGRY